MPGGFNNKPKILRGAFVEYGLTFPPLAVAFQYNPDELSRSRGLSFSAPNNIKVCRAGEEGKDGKKGKAKIKERGSSLRDFHKKKSLLDIQRDQQVVVDEEDISFDIRLDASDALNDGDPVARKYGIGPQLAALEMMTLPKDEQLIGTAAAAVLGKLLGFSFSKRSNPPMILFIWGLKRVLPVNITSLNIKETEFNTRLDPVRATVSVSLSVIEGKNTLYKYTTLMKERMMAANLSNLADITDVVIPG
jgi:hypothetical protein